MTKPDMRPLVAILRGVRPDEVVDISRAVARAGIRQIEVPLNSPDPFDSIERLASDPELSDCLVGAGTVLTPDDVDRVAQAKGLLAVAPNTNAAVIRRAIALGLLPMPGVATATDVFAAIDAGATLLKLFPASTYGPGHAKALKAVLPPSVSLFAVGGVKPSMMAEWLAAGVDGFGLGGELYKPGLDAAAVGQRAADIVAAFDAACAR